MSVLTSFRKKFIEMREDIILMLNGEIERIPPVKSDLTLMNWLRNNKNLTGTKEGCAEGDCGACTVVIGRYDYSSKAVAWRAVNSCILFLPMLDGCSVRTVEGLASNTGELHPVQTAFVENHASQCGFCTPGFVMSLYAGWCKNRNLDNAAIDDLFAGNLCRCTGYRPIKQAAFHTNDIPVKERDTLFRDEEEKFIIENLAREELSLQVKHLDRQIRFDAPRRLQNVQEILHTHTPLILSGGTDIGLWVTKKHMELDHFLYLGNVEALNQLDEDDEGFVIGAAITHEGAMQKMGAHFEALQELWRRFGSEQVRASGTVVGNIANGSPIADISPAFIALGASLTLNARGKIRVIPIGSFFIAYGEQDLQEGEFVQSVYIPKLKDNEVFQSFKISRRFDQDISAVMGAFLLSVDNDGNLQKAEIAYGGMAAIPKAASTLSKFLIGQDIENLPLAECRKAIEADFQPISDVRASREYRYDMALNLLVKAIYNLAGKPISYLAGADIQQVISTSFVAEHKNG